MCARLNSLKTGERLGKLSLWSWALGSVCQVVSEAWQLRIVQVSVAAHARHTQHTRISRHSRMRYLCAS